MSRSYDTLLAGLDLSELSPLLFADAVAAARSLGAAEVRLLSVVEAVQPWVTSAAMGVTGLAATLWDRLDDDARARLEDFVPPPDFAARVVREVRTGSPARVLAIRAAEVNASLILVASRDFTGLSRALLGSVTHTLLRTAHVPVVVLGERRRWAHPARVVAGVDLSATSPAVLEHAVSLARRCQAQLEVVSCFERPWVLDASGRPPLVTPAEEEALLAAHRDRLRTAMDHAGAAPEDRLEVVRERAPVAALVAAAGRGGPALLVVGASGQNGWQRLFVGSTARGVVEAATCPVLVVPAAEERGG